MPNHYTTIAICSPGYDFDVEAFNERHWANEHWGTKWGTYDAQAFALGGDNSPIAIKFQSAWSPPKAKRLAEIAEWLKREYGFKSVAFVGFDPYDNSTKMLEVNRAKS